MRRRAPLAYLESCSSAQCVISSGSTVVGGAESIQGSLIFSGVVVEESRVSIRSSSAYELGSRVAFEVDGLWKGTLPPKIVLFQPGFSEERYFVVDSALRGEEHPEAMAAIRLVLVSKLLDAPK